MSGLNKSREAYLQVLAKWRTAYDATLQKWQAEGADPAKAPFNVEALLQYDDAHVLKTIATFPKEHRKPLIELWALNRATADVQNWSSEWRKAKGFSHGVVGGDVCRPVRQPPQSLHRLAAGRDGRGARRRL